MTLREVETQWFDCHPDRQYLCRPQTDQEKGDDLAALSGPAHGLAIVQREDGGRIYMWSANPDLYLFGSDKSLAFWFDHYQQRAA